MSLENYLVLNRYLLKLLGFTSFENAKNLLRPLREGPDGNGQSHFLGALMGLGSPLANDLPRYDAQIMSYERRLQTARRDFRAFRYFQYLALLLSEIYLDLLTQDPQGLLNELNASLKDLRRKESDLQDFPDFTSDDLRRLAFFMATGSGKTLIMHVNIWQVLHYLRNSAHPEALLPGIRNGRDFDNILLITPNEGLSAQHLTELRASGLEAVLFVDNPNATGSSTVPLVKVIEIHKLTEQVGGEGVSIPLSAIGQNNLVIVDEGHKGTGSEAQTWKNRQKFLSEKGFLLEYSATFAQAIGAAGVRGRQSLLHEYGKAILFDYSYAHFYGDGYGKDFKVMNLTRAAASQAHELLIGGLLAFYQQLRVYHQNRDAFRPYHLEKPLWVMLGSSVNALYIQDKTRRSDVAEVVAFLKRFIEDPRWACGVIARILNGESGFQDSNGQDLFLPYVEELRGQQPQALYDEILRDVFQGSGGLEIWELKRAEGELGLRLSQARNEEAPYFGVINIGDVPEFKKYLQIHLNLDVKEDIFRPSQFSQIDRSDSSIYLLIGAKKFIEGWSSWRVSSMGLLNVGKGEGSQIIQLFGRGVRLKGREMSLKRSAALPPPQPEGAHPEDIQQLETLIIFGWNADYIQAFQRIISNEGIPQEIILRVAKMSPWPAQHLVIPEKSPTFDPHSLIWTLDASGPFVELDLTPRLLALQSRDSSVPIARRAGKIGSVQQVNFAEGDNLLLLDLDALYLRLLEYKALRRYDNLFITCSSVVQALSRCRVTLPQEGITPQTLQQAALQALQVYTDRFVRLKEREAESHHLVPARLSASDSRLIAEYRLRVRDRQLANQIREALQTISSQVQSLQQISHFYNPAPVPRLYFDRSLYNPLLLVWNGVDVSISPPGLNQNEKEFVDDLIAFWSSNHQRAQYAHFELYLLRNQSPGGVSLFHRSGFYPDFLLWVHNTQTGQIRLVFLEPHGLHHEGLSGNQDRFEALKAIRLLSQKPEFVQEKVTLDGYILTKTPLAQIPDAKGMTQSQIESQYPVLWMEGGYISRLIC